MCGISGFISKRRITLADLTAMNDTMYHRGPNDSGAEIYDAAGGYAVGFAQRRLSIMDLSPMGHQPMHAADKRISVVFNGEIYNFQGISSNFLSLPHSRSFVKNFFRSFWLFAFEIGRASCRERV